MTPIYCISGLGANSSVFSNLHIPGAELFFLEWLEPEKGESLSNYALRMSSGIMHENPVLLGVSFGGVVVQEIAAIRPVSQLILVSTLCSLKELPVALKSFQKIPLYNAIPDAVLMPILMQGLQGFGKMNEKVLQHFRNMLLERSPHYYRWAFSALLNWNGQPFKGRVLRIHGNQDKLFPIKKLQTNVEAIDGTHIAIYTKGKRISTLIHEFLIQLERPTLE